MTDDSCEMDDEMREQILAQVYQALNDQQRVMDALCLAEWERRSLTLDHDDVTILHNMVHDFQDTIAEIIEEQLRQDTRLN
jgi:hypothetical protein